MTRRLVTICLMTMFIFWLASPLVLAQGDQVTNRTLKGISAVYVLVGYLPDGAKTLGLTTEAIQTDVELKLRLAGMRVVTDEEHTKLPGMPYLYIFLNLMDRAQAGCIQVELHQNALLDANNEQAFAVNTWSTGFVLANPTAQVIRDRIKDKVDEFLNAWLSVNPKK
jgi:hypothetical protein